VRNLEINRGRDRERERERERKRKRDWENNAVQLLITR